MENNDSVIRWLLQGDPSIRWQTLRDLTEADEFQITDARSQISHSGWGKQLLSQQASDFLWSGGLYNPKWTSTTYTLLLLRRMGLAPENSSVHKSCEILIERGLYPDGGINFFKSLKHSETCVTGMILALACYFRIANDRLEILVNHLLGQQLKDGGWNCRSYAGDTHSSFHTTIIVLEALHDYEMTGRKKCEKAKRAQSLGREFLLAHQMYRSHRTGKIVKTELTRFSFPPRWYYDVLRGLDYFQAVNAEYDERLKDAIQLMLKRQGKDGCWILQNRHSGKTYFEMETIGEPSRWNTLRALRVLQWWNQKIRD
jgi:hypothetical protein